MIDNVCVILTTYNPKEYLYQQIKSIENQIDVAVEIIIRDDGSTNKVILNKIRKKENVTIIDGENLGVGKNIMSLVNYVYLNKKEYNYFAYSDQDDFWEKDKLITGINSLKKMNDELPNLYYSNLQVVDKELNPLHLLFKQGVVKNTCGQSLAQVFSFACTTVFNYKMIHELNQYDIKEMGFDSLIYYIAIFFGTAYYDDVPHIKYRQHGDNLSGSHERGLLNLPHRIIQIFNLNKMNQPFEYNANYLYQNMKKKMTNDQLGLVMNVCDYRKNIICKLRLLLNRKIAAGYYPKEFYRVIRILINKY